MEITHNQDGTISYEADGMRFCIDPDERLSEHFRLRELLYSYYAQQRGIVNLPRRPEIIPALRLLCREVLEPLRQALGRPVLISSGYRTPCVNFCVGGAKNSQHVRGEAADLHCRTEEQARTYYNYIRAHLPFDQLLLEHNGRSGAWWVHVSYTQRRANRKEAREFKVKSEK